MVKRIGLKYASRNSRHPDEAVAEAYFQLTILLSEDRKLYDLSDNKDRLVGTYVKRAIMKYFERTQSRTMTLLTDKIIRNTDEEMIDWLSGLLPDEDAFEVFQLLRGGVSLLEVDLVIPTLRRAAKRLKAQVAGRIRRIEALNAEGIKTTREIQYDPTLEDNNGTENPREEGS